MFRNSKYRFNPRLYTVIRYLVIVAITYQFLNFLYSPDFEVAPDTIIGYDSLAIGIRTGHSNIFDTSPMALISLNNVSSKMVFDEQEWAHEGVTRRIGRDMVKAAPVKRVGQLSDESKPIKNAGKRSNDIYCILFLTTACLERDEHDIFNLIKEFRMLYSTFPDKQWYILIPDQSFIFLDNMVYRLSHFSPSRPHYFGVSGRQPGNDRKSYKGSFLQYFGFGGRYEWENKDTFPRTTVILSKAAIQLLVAPASCEGVYSQCSGHVQLGQCLKAAHVKFTNLAGIYRISGQDNIEYPNNPCEIPLVLSAPLLESIQQMIDVQPRRVSIRHGNSVRGIVTYEDVMRSSLDNDGIQNDAIRAPKSSKVLSEGPSESVETCRLQCQHLKECVTFSYYYENLYDRKKMAKQGRCQLLDRMSGSKTSVGSTSGVILERYECKRQ